MKICTKEEIEKIKDDVRELCLKHEARVGKLILSFRIDGSGFLWAVIKKA